MVGELCKKADKLCRTDRRAINVTMVGTSLMICFFLVLLLFVSMVLFDFSNAHMCAYRCLHMCICLCVSLREWVSDCLLLQKKKNSVHKTITGTSRLSEVLN